MSVFFPGAFCCLERDTGTVVWRREFPKFGGSSVYLHDGKLFAKTANSLFSLSQDSGDTLWSFSPYGTEGESIYSSPSAHEDRVYIGDRRGYLHCLDIDSGATIWKHPTNDLGADVNSTPLLLRGLVIVTTNAKSAVAYEASSGKLAWEQKLDGPSTFGPIAHDNSVLAVSNSLYVLDVENGEIRQRLSRHDRKVHQAVSAAQSIIFLIKPERPYVEISAKTVNAITASASEAMSKTTLCIVSSSGKPRQRHVATFCPQFRYDSATDLVYLSHLGGVDILRPSTGALVSRLASDESGRGIGLVDVADGKIYVLVSDGMVYALRHPTQFR